MTAGRANDTATATRKAGEIEWWPIGRFLKAPTDPRAFPVWLAWLGLTALSIGSAFLEARLDWSGMPLTIGGRTLGLTIYPPVAISAFIAFWLGPTYGATTAYLSSLVSGFTGGLEPLRTSMFALGTPAEVLLLWFLSTILRVRPTLREYQDWWRFCAAAVLATTASSLDIMLYNEAHHLPFADGQRLWEGWIFGDIAQLCLVVAPLLSLVWAPAHRMSSARIGAPKRELSARNTVLLVGFVWAILGGLALFGFRLLVRALDLPSQVYGSASDQLMPPLVDIETFFIVFCGALLLSTMALTAALASRGEQVVALSLRDDLTGAFNRRAFRTLFDREEERSRTVDRPISIISFDLDHFKDINDQQGHSEGDRVLVAVTGEAQTLLRPQDLLFRWGGDEFVILLPHSRREEAYNIAEQLRARVESQVVTRTRNGARPVTMSLGVATARADAGSDALIRAADAAIYQAKALGRNRVMIAEDTPRLAPAANH
jgi:diguanylate cyclase (GGDEF)-like protein